jgi:bifunctional DNA-binding transcriptional regulator/antitoxin component of YhaV-PrlF toxin-antitoxin module
MVDVIGKFKSTNFEQLSRTVVDNAIIFKTTVSPQGQIIIPSREVESSNVTTSEPVRVYVARVNAGDKILRRDRNIFVKEPTTQNRVTIPQAIRESAGIQPGDVIQVVAYNPRAFKGAVTNPIRSLISGSSREGGRSRDDVAVEGDTAEFVAPVPEFGQVSIPSEVMRKLDLVQGDELSKVEMENISGDDPDQGKTATMRNVEIKSRDRITVTRSKQQELHLARKGEEVEFTLTK